MGTERFNKPLHRFLFGFLLNLPWIYFLACCKNVLGLMLAAILASFATLVERKYFLCRDRNLNLKREFLIDFVVFLVAFYVIRRVI